MPDAYDWLNRPETQAEQLNRLRRRAERLVELIDGNAPLKLIETECELVSRSAAELFEGN